MSGSCLVYFVKLDSQCRIRSSGRVPFALLAYSHFRRTHVPLVLTLPAYLHAACTHTSDVLICRLYSHTLRGFVVLTVSVTPDMVSSRSSHTLCVGSLSLRYLSRLAYTSSHPYSHTLHDLVVLLTRLAWD